MDSQTLNFHRNPCPKSNTEFLLLLNRVIESERHGGGLKLSFLGVLSTVQGQGWVFRGYSHLYGGRCSNATVTVKVSADSSMMDEETRP